MILLTILSLLMSYFMFFNYVDVHESTISYNVITGETKVDTLTGANFTYPWVLVNQIDTRPRRICVTTSSRNFNCMLVSFDPKGYKEFVEVEGFYYFWWANRISYNMGHDQEYRGMDNLILGYSFDNTKRSFIKIHQDLGK